MGKIWLNQNRYTIIDEADELVGPDWMDDMKKIMSGGGVQLYLLSMLKIVNRL